MSKLVFKDFSGWRNGKDFLDVTLTQVSADDNPNKVLAFVFFGHVNLDFDGSPTAYGPLKVHPDDKLGNAGNIAQGYFGVASAAPGNYWVREGLVVIDTDAPGLHPGGNKALPVEFPVVQQTKFGDPKQGFYVSTTPRNKLAFIGGVTKYRQFVYVDASEVAFGALDLYLQRDRGVQMGDFELAVRHDQDRQSAFYFVDAGGWNHALGECSHRVGLDLGVTKLGPGHWDNNFPVSFILFPRTAIRRVFDDLELDDAAIRKNVETSLREIGKAENARDLPLLMAANEASPLGVAKGAAGLAAFRKAKGAHAWISGSATTIQIGLAEFGFRRAGPAP